MQMTFQDKEISAEPAYGKQNRADPNMTLCSAMSYLIFVCLFWRQKV